MNDKKQRQLPEIINKRQKREHRCDGNPNKKSLAGDVQDLLASHMSKPIGCTLPDINRGCLMGQHKGNTMRETISKVVPIHFPPLENDQKQVKKLSKQSSACSLMLDSQHYAQCFEEQELPVIPADCGSNKSCQLRPKRLLPVHLPSIATMSGYGARHKPKMTPLTPTTILQRFCKLPEIKNNSHNYSRPVSRKLHRLPSVLPPISGRTEEIERSLNCKHAASQYRQRKKEKQN